MTRKKPSRSALRRRSRPERPQAGPHSARPPEHAQRVLAELEQAGEPLTPKELAKRLRLGRDEKESFEKSLLDLERAGGVVRNRAGALLVARRIDVVAGRVEGHPDGHGFLVPDEAGQPSVFLAPGEMRQVLHG